MEEYAEKGFNLDWSRGRQIEREAGGRTGRSEKDERQRKLQIQRHMQIHRK